jgi:hypothetical protein
MKDSPMCISPDANEPVAVADEPVAVADEPVAATVTVYFSRSAPSSPRYRTRSYTRQMQWQIQEALAAAETVGATAVDCPHPLVSPRGGRRGRPRNRRRPSRSRSRSRSLSPSPRSSMRRRPERRHERRDEKQADNGNCAVTKKTLGRQSMYALALVVLVAAAATAIARSDHLLLREFAAVASAWERLVETAVATATAIVGGGR